MSIISRHQSKGQTYARFLDSIRSAGLWSQPAPITPKGILINSTATPSDALPWSELIRKYLKHNPDRELTAETATTELALRLLLVSADQAVGYDHDQIHRTDDPETGQAMLPPLVKVEDQEAVRRHIAKLATTLDKHSPTETTPTLAGEQNAAGIVISFGHYLIGEFDECLQFIEKCNFKLPETTPPNTEKYESIILVMGLAVKALAYERKGVLPSTVVEAYNRVSEAYNLCLSHLSLDYADELNNELYYWAELAMYRACILSKTTSPGISSLESHRKYCSSSEHWPLSFRLHKRCVIFKSYIRLIFATTRTQSWKPPSGQSNTVHSPTSVFSFQDREPITISLKNPTWKNELSMIERLYSAYLQQTTSFPRAGSTNHLMLDFCDLLFEGWQLGGSDVESASQIVVMLYEATRKTFHSQKVLRYQIQLLAVKADWDEAEAALDLYHQLYTIGRTTAIANPSCSSDDAPESVVDEVSADGYVDISEGNNPSVMVSDHDTEEEFVETMIYGSRMLIKFIKNPGKASKLLDSAKEVLESAKDEGIANNTRLKSRLARMRGVAAGAQAQKADQETRPALHASYLELLNAAAEMNPSSFETMYHLAYAQAELRDIDSALVTARTAVELNPSHSDAWHLLCLLTSASKELKLALDIAEVGLVNTEEIDDDETGMRTPKGSSFDPNQEPSLLVTASAEETQMETSETPITSDSQSTSVLGTDVSTTPPSQQDSERRLALPTVSSTSGQLDNERYHTPTASYRSQNAELEFPIDKAGKLEADIQLRMTKNVLLEALQGPEVALSDQQNLFAFFARVYSQIHSEDVLQMVKSQTKPALITSISNSKSPYSTLSTTHRLSLRSARSKSIKGKLEARLSQSISGRSHPSQTSIPPNLRSSLGAVQMVKTSEEITDTVKKEETEKKELSTNFKSIKTLQDLWLMSAGTFRRWGKELECRGAIEEAERLNPDSPEVWVQFGLYCLSISDLKLAVESLTKAISFDDQYIPAVVHLSRILKEEGSIELAESLLDVLTQTAAWDTPEAWYLLSEIYLITDRLKRGKECLLFSLSLEESKPIRPLRLCLPFCL